MIKLNYKLLIYDIETGLLNADIFRLGEQAVRSNQLTNIGNKYNIICITAKFFGEKKIYTFYGDQGVKDFDNLVRTCDVIIGKNNGRFDDRRCNTARMLLGIEPNMEMFEKSEDLEKQVRRYFDLASFSLDYLSRIFGEGGKDKMEFEDWQKIRNFQLLDSLGINKNSNKVQDYKLSNILFGKGFCTVIREGKSALRKMVKYNIKDVEDTEKALIKVLPYIKLSGFNANVEHSEGKGCRVCGCTKLAPTEITVKGKTKYQHFECLSDSDKVHYAGKAVVKYDRHRNRVFGKIS